MPAIPDEEAAMPYEPDEPESSAGPGIAAVKRRNEDRLMAIEGVRGVGIGTDEIGNDVILVYLLDAAARERVPGRVEGVEVRTTIVGEIDAYRSGGG